MYRSQKSCGPRDYCAERDELHRWGGLGGVAGGETTPTRVTQHTPGEILAELPGGACKRDGRIRGWRDPASAAESPRR